MPDPRLVSIGQRQESSIEVRYSFEISQYVKCENNYHFNENAKRLIEVLCY